MKRIQDRAGRALLALGFVGVAGLAIAQPSWFGIPQASAHASAPDDRRQGEQEAGYSRLAEVKVELAWLADPATFPYYLSALVNGTDLEVRGHVPDEAAHQKALALARAQSTLPVRDALTVNANVAFRPESQMSATLQRDAADVLQAEFPQAGQAYEVKAQADGQVTVAGSVSSFEEKLSISLRLRRLRGCTAVINQLNVVPALLDGQSVVKVSADGRKRVPSEVPAKAGAPRTAASATATATSKSSILTAVAIGRPEADHGISPASEKPVPASESNKSGVALLPPVPLDLIETLTSRRVEPPAPKPVQPETAPKPPPELPGVTPIKFEPEPPMPVNPPPTPKPEPVVETTTAVPSEHPDDAPKPVAAQWHPVIPRADDPMPRTVEVEPPNSVSPNPATAAMTTATSTTSQKLEHQVPNTAPSSASVTNNSPPVVEAVQRVPAVIPILVEPPVQPLPQVPEVKTGPSIEPTGPAVEPAQTEPVLKPLGLFESAVMHVPASEPGPAANAGQAPTAPTNVEPAVATAEVAPPRRLELPPATAMPGSHLPAPYRPPQEMNYSRPSSLPSLSSGQQNMPANVQNSSNHAPSSSTGTPAAGTSIKPDARGIPQPKPDAVGWYGYGAAKPARPVAANQPEPPAAEPTQLPPATPTPGPMNR